jgi:hypothetical protein
MIVTRVLSVVVAVALLAGCSASAKPTQTTPAATPTGSTSTGSTSARPSAPPTPQCPPALRTMFAHAAKTGTVAVQGDVSGAYLACQLQDQHAAAGACTSAKVTINDESQAYWDFQRWVVESGQTAGQSGQPDLAPVQKNVGIGIESDWIAATRNFEAARSDRWVAVFLTCPASGARELTLAEELARVAMNS